MLVFDIETTGLNPRLCVVTVVCTQDFLSQKKEVYEFGRMRSECPEEIEELTLRMIKAFDEAESLCAFNGIRFDIPFLRESLNISKEKTAQ